MITRQAKTDERKVSIVKALTRLMATRGYERASVAEIAATAGIPAGLIHYHFKNKLEILLAVLEHVMTTHLGLVEKAIDDAAGNPRNQLVAFIELHLGLDHANRERLACWIAISAESLKQPSVHHAYQRWVTRLTSLLEGVVRRGVEVNAFHTSEVNAAASAIHATIQGYFLISATCPGSIPRGTAAHCTLKMALALLEASDP
jgi:TetR/AcrR family transcriptional repressor of bet genes